MQLQLTAVCTNADSVIALIVEACYVIFGLVAVMQSHTSPYNYRLIQAAEAKLGTGHPEKNITLTTHVCVCS